MNPMILPIKLLSLYAVPKDMKDPPYTHTHKISGKHMNTLSTLSQEIEAYHLQTHNE